MMTTAQKLAKLKELSTGAGESVFERTALAAEILADRSWVEINHGGSESLARSALAAEHFRDQVGGEQALDYLLEILHHFPKRQQWAAHKYSAARLWAAVEEIKAGERGQRQQKTATVIGIAEHERQIKKIKDRCEDKIAQAQNELQLASKAKDDLVAQLRQENAELRRELAATKDELARLRQSSRGLAAMPIERPLVATAQV